MASRVLLVSDNLEVGRLWAPSLSQKQIDVVLAGSGEEALACWAREAFDLLVVDIHSPQVDGPALCRRLRSEIVNPVLLLTPRSDEAHLLDAYQAGVDECIPKPIGPALFVAKVMAWLHRSWTVTAASLDSLQVGNLSLDSRHRQVLTTAGRVIKLTNLEFRLLHLLMSHAGQVMTTDLILDRVWGYTDAGDSIALKNVVYRLRRKIEPDPTRPHYIQAVAGVGYTYQLH